MLVSLKVLEDWDIQTPTAPLWPGSGQLGTLWWTRRLIPFASHRCCSPHSGVDWHWLCGIASMQNNHISIANMLEMVVKCRQGPQVATCHYLYSFDRWLQDCSSSFANEWRFLSLELTEETINMIIYIEWIVLWVSELNGNASICSLLIVA